MKRDKIITEARERFAYAQERWGPIYKCVRDDLKFSDPTDPQQWPEDVKRERQNSEGGPRPCLVFDQIGQYVRQVINTARRNKPAMKFIPVDDRSDPKLADVLQGLARQVEYESRADVAYIGALDSATRGGLGYFRLITEEDKTSPVKGKVNAKIARVADFETVLPDPDFMEPDGSDMQWGFVIQAMTKAAFLKKWPKAKVSDFDEEGWFGDKHVRIAEYFRIVETQTNVLTVNGQEMGEDEYWEAAQAGSVDTAIRPEASLKTEKRVEWFKISGDEVLEETTFPGPFVPLFPVLGNETWEDGKRKLGGCVRPSRDPQISYNFERNSEIEAVSIGPKAPWLAPVEATEGHDNKWKRANSGNIVVLPYNSLTESGDPIQKPERISPAGIAAGWTALSDRSRMDIQAGLGMFNPNADNIPNRQSGRAVLALKDQADVGSFQYVDNLALTMSHLGRVLTEVWPVIFDAEQIVRIIGEDDEPTFIRIDPQSPSGYAEKPTHNGSQPVVNLNPEMGRFDVRCVVGPAYSTRQSEAAAHLSELVNGNPQMMAMVGDVWMKMQNWPEHEKLARRFNAMLPPQVKAAEGEGQQLPPEVMQAIQAMQQENQQLQQALQEAQSGMAQEQIRAQTTLQKAQMDNDAKRDVEELKGMVQLLIQQLQPPPQLASEVSQDFAQS